MVKISNILLGKRPHGHIGIYVFQRLPQMDIVRLAGMNPRPATQGQNIYRNRVSEQRYFWKNVFLKYDIDSWTDFGIHIYNYRHSWTSFVRAPYYATQKFETWHYFWTIAFDLVLPDLSLTLETTYTGDNIDVLLLDPDFLVFHYEKLDIVDFQITIPLQFDTHKYIYAIVIKWDPDFQYFSGFYRIDKPS